MGLGWERAPSGWRWLVVVGVVALLVALPGLVGVVPARDRGMAAGAVVGRGGGAGVALGGVVGPAGGVAYRGLAEARGGLGLPDVPRTGRVVALLGETTR